MIVVRVVGYRWADYDTPLWVNPNRAPGRWHRVGAAPTQYWSLHPLGPWAEYLRAAGIRDAAELEGIASRTWAAAFEFDDGTVAEINFSTAISFGIAPEALVADNHQPCQDLAARIRDDHPAIVVPSAALPGADNLVVFGARVAAAYGPVIDPAVDVATAPTAEGGRPPASLVDLVCHRGDRHAGLEAWRAGSPIAPPALAYPL